MSKLRTPITYEPKLVGLSEVLPLILTDEVRQVISILVADKRVVNSVSPVEGTLLRCTKQGALLKSPNKVGNKNYELVSRNLYEDDKVYKISFAQEIHGVVFWYYARDAVETKLYWCNSDGTILTQIYYNQLTWYNFVGTSLWIKFNLGWAVHFVRCFGFY